MLSRLAILFLIFVTSFAGNKGFKGKGKPTYTMDPERSERVQDSKDSEDFENLSEDLNFEEVAQRNVEVEKQQLPVVVVEKQKESQLDLDSELKKYLPLAIAAAKSFNHDPEYIQDIFGRLGKIVRKFHYDKKVSSELEMLALFISMGAFSESVFGHESIYGTIAALATMQALERTGIPSPKNTFWEQASQIAECSLPRKFQPAWDAARKHYLEDFKTSHPQKIAETVPFKVTFAAVSDAKKETTDLLKILTIAGRVSELRAFLVMLRDANEILERSYTEALKALESLEDLRGNPFEKGGWNEFREFHFDTLPSHVSIYIKPWIKLFDSLSVQYY